MSKNNITTEMIDAEEFDRLADNGSDEIDKYLDWANATRPGLKIKRTQVDLPEHIIAKLDRAAALRGVTRQALIKLWLFEKLAA